MDSPASGIQKSRPRFDRKPLQPKNSPAEPLSRGDHLEPNKPAPRPFQITSPSSGTAVGKENQLQGMSVAAAELTAGISPMDTSLAEELGAGRRRRERLRSDREKTEEMLMERGRLLDRAMREVERRWEEQRRVELELRRLIRLQQLGSPCGRSPTFQSLREREEEKRKKDAQSEVIKNEETQIVVKEKVDAESSGSKEERGIQNLGEANDSTNKSQKAFEP